MEELMPKFRLGTIAPRAGESGIGPYQFYRVLPRDVMQITASLELEDYTRPLVQKAMGNYWRCVEALVGHKVDRIVQTGIPIASQMGRAYMLDLIRETEKRTGIPADADLEAVIAGMHHLGVKTVTIASRWADQLNQALTDYLEAGGLKVVGVTTRGQWGAQAFAMSLEEGMRLAVALGREAMRLAPQAEGILVPGGTWISLHAIPILEAEFGRPAFTNLNGMVWNAVIRTGVVAPIQGWGRLLASKGTP